MKVLTRQRLPFVLTGLLVLLAIAAVIVFLATGGATPASAPTPTRAAGSGTEVLPPTATPTIAHLGTEQDPLVTAPLPKTASAKGKLVTGFPTQVIAIPAGLTIENSSVASEGEHLQVTLVGTSAGTQGDVQAFYQTALSALGMTGAAASSAAGSTATTYSRGTDNITVTTTADSTGTQLSILGVFTAGTS